MKSSLLSILCLLVLSIIFSDELKAQPGPSSEKDALSDPNHLLPEDNGRAISFGYFEFNSGALNNYLDTAIGGKTDGFSNYYLGISIDNISNGGKHHDIISSFSFIIPQKVHAGANDSLEMRLGGWHWTTSFFGYDFVKGETVTLALAPAMSWGNLKMRRIVQDQKTKYTNPFVGVGGRAEFRLTFGSFMIGGRATYRYDITHGLWKRKDNLMPVLPEYKNHGLAYFGYIGWIF